MQFQIVTQKNPAAAVCGFARDSQSDATYYYMDLICFSFYEAKLFFFFLMVQISVVQRKRKKKNLIAIYFKRKLKFLKILVSALICLFFFYKVSVPSSF